MPRMKFRVEDRIVTLAHRRYVHEIRSEASARIILQALVDQYGEGMLRELVDRALPMTVGLPYAEILRRATGLLVNGELIVFEHERLPRVLDPAPVVSLASLVPEPERATDWIAVRLLDLEGQAVASEPYVMELSDGSEIRGETDDLGRARHDGVSAGRCRIRFPNAGGRDVFDPSTRAAVTASLGSADASAPFVSPPAPAQPEPTPAPHVLGPEEAPAPGKTWLVLEVDDDDGLPVDATAFIARLPGGEEVRGETEDGRIELRDIATGGIVELVFAAPALASANGPYPTGHAYLAIASGGSL